jgi:hypothetical protein
MGGKFIIREVTIVYIGFLFLVVIITIYYKVVLSAKLLKVWLLGHLDALRDCPATACL